MPAELRFDGRVAIVTGAGGGLGRQHALLLAHRGASLVVNDLGSSVTGHDHDVGPAHQVAEEINAAGGHAIASTESIATPEGAESLVNEAVDTFGRVDILVNNAGILGDAPFEDMTPEVLEPVLDVHLRGAFYVTRPAWRLMLRQSYGRIVNTSSSSGLYGMFHQSNYAAAKMGLVGLTRVLANEAAGYDIKVNALAPTAWTRMNKMQMPAEWEDKLRPELVSPMVAWLVHEDCPVNGEIYAAGGGYAAQVFIGLTKGIFEQEITVETVRDRFADVRDRRGFREPTFPSDEFFDILDRLGVDNPLK